MPCASAKDNRIAWPDRPLKDHAFRALHTAAPPAGASPGNLGARVKELCAAAATAARGRVQPTARARAPSKPSPGLVPRGNGGPWRRRGACWDPWTHAQAGIGGASPSSSGVHVPQAPACQRPSTHSAAQVRARDLASAATPGSLGARAVQAHRTPARRPSKRPQKENTLSARNSVMVFSGTRGRPHPHAMPHALKALSCPSPTALAPPPNPVPTPALASTPPRERDAPQRGTRANGVWHTTVCEMLPLPSAGPCNSATVVVCPPPHHRAGCHPSANPYSHRCQSVPCPTRADGAAAMIMHLPVKHVPPTTLWNLPTPCSAQECSLLQCITRTPRMEASVRVLHTTRGLVLASITMNSTHTPISKATCGSRTPTAAGVVHRSQGGGRVSSASHQLFDCRTFAVPNSLPCSSATSINHSQFHNQF